MVISVVNYEMVEQVSLASAAYAKGVNEFIKAGLTAVTSDRVAPPRVGESPVSFECKVKDVITTGKRAAGAGYLVVCEIVMIHIKESVIHASSGKLDTRLLDAVGRMGDHWYCRAVSGMFEVKKPPIGKACIGVDKLPKAIRESKVLTGNDLGKLGSVESLPPVEAVKAYVVLPAATAEDYHRLAQARLLENKVEEAWKILLRSPH